MEFAIWAYAWDLLDEGVESAATRLEDLGVTEINLATNYHHVQAFTPHNPERRTFFAKASSYFQPGDGYGDIEPIPLEAMGDEDWVHEIAEQLADTGITLTSWTIGVHNSRLGMRHPEATIENAFGDRLVFGLCPSNPAVQSYLIGLVSDLAGRDVFRRIELESFDYFHGSGFGWHHEKFHARLGELGEFLFGVCFCSHCRATANDAGVEVDRARTVVREAIDAIIAGDVPFELSPSEWLRAHPAVRAYVDVREETLESLYADVARAAGSADLGYYLGVMPVEQTWMAGVDPDGLGAHVDHYTVAAYESSRPAVLDTVRIADTLTPDMPLHAGILPGHPAIHDADTLSNVVDGLAAYGVPRLSLYNYGLLPDRNLDWIAEATAPHI
jgi:hypothetical protein